jgi:hypothetical protein
MGLSVGLDVSYDNIPEFKGIEEKAGKLLVRNIT